MTGAGADAFYGSTCRIVSLAGLNDRHQWSEPGLSLKWVDAIHATASATHKIGDADFETKSTIGLG